ncbi:MAG: Nif3-like dinuclear metal center hexameric protein, partial [Clostridia bacterium]|nr:Nif3-like dinuclear metal center hexameric protein [Clostridia bacterium]
TLVTAECKYRHFTLARDLGINLIDAGHYATEAAVLRPLRLRLEEVFPDLTFGTVEGDPVSVKERRGL